MRGPRPVRCPNCRTDSCQPRDVSGVTVDKCSACGGAWFERGELEKLYGDAVRSLAVPADAWPGPRGCPACRRALVPFEYPQTRVTVDLCPSCGGLWLDSGEYQEILAVRAHLAQQGKLDAAATVGGVKGALLRFIDTALGALKPGDA